MGLAKEAYLLVRHLVRFASLLCLFFASLLCLLVHRACPVSVRHVLVQLLPSGSARDILVYRYISLEPTAPFSPSVAAPQEVLYLSPSLR